MKGGNVAMIEAALACLNQGRSLQAYAAGFTADEEQTVRERGVCCHLKGAQLKQVFFANRRTSASLYAKEAHYGSEPLSAWAHASDPDYGKCLMRLSFIRHFLKHLSRRIRPIVGSCERLSYSAARWFMTNVIPGKEPELDIRLLPGQPTSDSIYLAQTIAKASEQRAFVFS